LSGSIWQHLVLAGIGKQLVPFSNGIDHGIAAAGFCAVRLYHVMLGELFMVSAISHCLMYC
jgi:hypothetical protein